MKIIICEDNPRESSLLKTIVKAHFNECTIEVFDNGSSLLDHMNQNEADILLLDVEMPGINGIETAKRLRGNHPSTGIIFITGHTDFALEAFEVYAFDYILKPVDGERLINSLDRITKKLNIDTYIEFHSQGMLFRVREKDIFFVEKNYNKCFIHTLNYTYTTVKPLKHFEGLLDNSSFVKTHNVLLSIEPEFQKFPAATHKTMKSILTSWTRKHF